MSFIYEDKKLIDELVKVGKDFEDKFTIKTAQPVVQGPPNEYVAYLDMTKKLVDQLENEYYPINNNTNNTNKTENQPSNKATENKQNVGSQDLRKFLGKFPLLPDRIDFQRIANFARMMPQLAPQVVNESVFYKNINDELIKINSNFRTGTAQGLKEDLETIMRSLPKGVTPYAYISSLYTLLSNVINLLNNLKSANYDMMDKELQQQIDQQVGSDSDDASSIASRNIDDIKDLLNEAKNKRF